MTLFVLVYVLVGYVLYRRTWPKGFLLREPDPERERMRRIGRRRVEPSADLGEEES